MLSFNMQVHKIADRHFYTQYYPLSADPFSIKYIKNKSGFGSVQSFFSH